MFREVILGFGLLSLLASLSACTRQALDSSVVEIQIPRKLEVSEKTSAMSTIDYSRLCFYVNVKGPGIPESRATCDVDRGLFKGGAVPGDSLTIEVPAGSGRVFEIFGFLRNAVAESCPIDFPTGQLGRVYELGKKAGVAVTPPETVVEISITLPTQAANVVATRQLPATCSGETVSGVAQGRFRALSHDETKTSFRLQSRVTEVTGQTLVGSKFILRGKVRGE